MYVIFLHVSPHGRPQFQVSSEGLVVGESALVLDSGELSGWAPKE